MLGSILARIGAGDTKETDDFKMSISDAIQLVQVHERARQGRLRAKFMREIRLALIILQSVIQEWIFFNTLFDLLKSSE